MSTETIVTSALRVHRSEFSCLFAQFSAQVYRVKSDRRIIGADVGTLTNICYTELTRLGKM